MTSSIPHMCRLLSEIADVLGDRKEVTADDLDKLKYTEQVLSHIHTYDDTLHCLVYVFR